MTTIHQRGLATSIKWYTQTAHFLLTKTFHNFSIFKLWAAQTSPQSSYLPNPPAMSKFVFKSPVHWKWSCTPVIKSHLVPWWRSGGCTLLPSPPAPGKPMRSANRNISFQPVHLKWLQMPICNRLWYRIYCTQSLFRDSEFIQGPSLNTENRLHRHSQPDALCCRHQFMFQDSSPLSLLPPKLTLLTVQLLTLNHTHVRCPKETV